MTNRNGPSRQWSLFEWNIPGQPDADGGTTNSDMNTLPGTSSLQNVRTTQNQCVIPDEDPNRGLSLDGVDEEGDHFDLMGEGVGDEDDGGEDEVEEDAQADVDSESTNKC
jgi:hypothetical protein